MTPVLDVLTSDLHLREKSLLVLYKKNKKSSFLQFCFQFYSYTRRLEIKKKKKTSLSNASQTGFKAVRGI